MFPNQQVLQDNCGYDFDNGENLAKWRGIFQSSLEKVSNWSEMCYKHMPKYIKFSMLGGWINFFSEKAVLELVTNFEMS